MACPVLFSSWVSCASCHSWACSQEFKTSQSRDEKQDSQWWSLGVTGFLGLLSTAGVGVHSECAGAPLCTLSSLASLFRVHFNWPSSLQLSSVLPGSVWQDLFSLAWVPVTQGTRHTMKAFLGFSLSPRKRCHWLGEVS